MKHTPAPWKVYGYSIHADTPDTSTEICYMSLYIPNEEQKANAQLISAAPECYEELKEADRVICELCKRLNPQHATADYGKGCDWCQDRDSRLKALTKAKGRTH